VKTTKPKIGSAGRPGNESSKTYTALILPLICQIIALLVIFTLFVIGTWISIIGGLKQIKTTSTSEGISAIVVGTCILTLSGLMASLIGKLYRC